MFSQTRPGTMAVTFAGHSRYGALARPNALAGRFVEGCGMKVFPLS